MLSGFGVPHKVRSSEAVSKCFLPSSAHAPEPCSSDAGSAAQESIAWQGSLGAAPGAPSPELKRLYVFAGSGNRQTQQVTGTEAWTLPVTLPA